MSPRARSPAAQDLGGSGHGAHLPVADSHGRYFIPRSGAITTFSRATWGSARRTRAVISFGLLITTLGVYGLAWLLNRNTL
jgi:hypothetical protein